MIPGTWAKRLSGLLDNLAVYAVYGKPKSPRLITGPLPSANHGTTGHVSAVAADPSPQGSAPAETPTADRIPQIGVAEATTVQPEGDPTHAGACREHQTPAGSGGAATGAIDRSDLSDEGCRQTPQGDSNGCQGGPIHDPAHGQHHPGSHGAGLPPIPSDVAPDDMPGFPPPPSPTETTETPPSVFGNFDTPIYPAKATNPVGTTTDNLPHDAAYDELLAWKNASFEARHPAFAPRKPL